MTTGLTVAGQAERLCLDEAVIRYTIAEYLHQTLPPDGALDPWLVDEVDDVLNRGGVLTVPQLYGQGGTWPWEDDT